MVLPGNKKNELLSVIKRQAPTAGDLAGNAEVVR